MKYQVGQKVIYDSGDWWFYGTVTAVIENSISPCYRLNVDQMIKKNCNLSITQFEFELKPVDDVHIPLAQSKWEISENEYNSQLSSVQRNNSIPQPVQEPKQDDETKPSRKKRIKNIPAPEEPNPENVDIQPIVDIKQSRWKRGEAWEKNLDLYQKGAKTSQIYTWVSQNRKLYNASKLPDDRLEKLIEINFPFEVKKKVQNKKIEDNKTPKNKDELSDAWWNHKCNQWIKGDRDSLQQWRQKCVKLYVNHKLSQNRIEKLKEIGILK